MLQFFHQSVVLCSRLLYLSIPVLYLLLEIVDLLFVHVALVLLLQDLVFLILKEALDLLVQDADLPYVFLMQIAHLLEHLSRDFRSFLVVLLVSEPQQVLQLVDLCLLLLNFALELQQ